MQRIKKTAKIAALQGRPLRDDVTKFAEESGYTEPQHTQPLEPVQVSSCSGGSYVENSRKSTNQPGLQTTTCSQSRQRTKRENEKKYADKRRHTAVMRIKVGDTV